MRKPVETLSILLLFVVSSLITTPVAATEFDRQHQKWQDILSTYVQVNGPSSRVRYRELKQNSSLLDSYLTDVSEVRLIDFEQWSRQQQLAYLINAYNALTIKLVITHYPVKSIKDIGNFFRSAWKINFFNLLGEERNLDNIEHELIRNNSAYNEPRIHFALVCASKACPKLQSTAFTDENLEQLLEQGTKEFLTDTSRNRYNADDAKLELSKIFKWYGADFTNTQGANKHASVQSFVSKYIMNTTKLQNLIATDKVTIEYMNYDWSLNDIDS